MGPPGQDVGLSLIVVTTCCKEYKNRRMVIDISNEVLIQYSASNLDDNSGEDYIEDGKDPMQDMLAGGEGEDDSDDDEDVEDNIQRMVLKVANRTNDSGFWSSVKHGNKIEVLTGVGVHWTSVVPEYPLGVLAGSSSFQSSHPVRQVSAD